MRILYVCTGNSFRSPVAEALTRSFHPDLEVESAGTEPAQGIADEAQELLDEEDAEEYLKPSPDELSQRAVDDADMVVSMMPEHAAALEDFETGDTLEEVWYIEDPVADGVAAESAFRQLERKVRELSQP